MTLSLTVDEFNGMVEEIGHENPVDGTGTEQ